MKTQQMTMSSGQHSLQMIHRMQMHGSMNWTKNTALKVMKMLIVAVHLSLRVKREKCFSGLLYMMDLESKTVLTNKKITTKK